MNIEVTQKDISDGTPHSFTSCPIALALGRVLPEKEFQVDCWDAFNAELGAARLPLCASNFVYDFDCGFPVAPFKFDLEFPRV